MAKRALFKARRAQRRAEIEARFAEVVKNCQGCPYEPEDKTNLDVCWDCLVNERPPEGSPRRGPDGQRIK